MQLNKRAEDALQFAPVDLIVDKDPKNVQKYNKRTQALENLDTSISSSSRHITQLFLSFFQH